MASFMAGIGHDMPSLVNAIATYRSAVQDSEKKRCMKKETPIKGGHGACLNCPPTEEVLPLNYPIMAGFGSAQIWKDEELIWEETSDTDIAPRLEIFERMATGSPNRDWRFKLDLPLRSAEYQRQGVKKWVLVKKGIGFA